MYKDSRRQQMAQAIAGVRAKMDALPNASRMSQQEVESIYGLGYRELEQGHYPEAFRCFSVLSLLKPTSARYWRGLALSCRMLAQYGVAADIYRFVGALEPDDPQHDLDLAECLLLQHKVNAARETFERLIASCTNVKSAEKVSSRARALLGMIPADDTASA